jgi:hypothetical protein
LSRDHVLWSRLYCLHFRVYNSGLRVHGLRLTVYHLGFGVEVLDVGFRFSGKALIVKGLRFTNLGFRM